MKACLLLFGGKFTVPSSEKSIVWHAHIQIRQGVFCFFWTAFGLSWLLIPVLAASGLGGIAVDAIKYFFGYGYTKGILLASLNFIILAAVFCFTNYIFMNRQQQKV